MNRDDAIEIKRKALLCEIAWLFTWLRIEPGGSVAEMTRFMASSVLFVLRPAESALRRLLVIEARKLKDTITLRTRKPRAANTPPSRVTAVRKVRAPLFPLVDKPIKKRKEPLRAEKPKIVPRITVLDMGMSPIEHHIWKQQQRALPKPKRAPKPPRNAPPNAAKLCRRLHAISHALENMQQHIDRMARALARRDALGPDHRGEGPLRHGHPPGHRQRAKQPIDAILRDCVLMERRTSFEAFDTS